MAEWRSDQLGIISKMTGTVSHPVIGDELS